MFNAKKALTKLMQMVNRTNQKLARSVVGTSTYTSNTAWIKAGNFTISETGIYQIRSIYSNAGVLGIAYSLNTHTSIAQAEILVENSTAGSVYALAILYGGQTYSVWTKCATNGRTNPVQVNKLVGLP